MYFKKNWGSMAAKEPPLGRVDIFQTSPNHAGKFFKVSIDYIVGRVKHL